MKVFFDNSYAWDVVRCKTRGSSGEILQKWVIDHLRDKIWIHGMLVTTNLLLDKFSGDEFSLKYSKRTSTVLVEFEKDSIIFRCPGKK